MKTQTQACTFPAHEPRYCRQRQAAMRLLIRLPASVAGLPFLAAALLCVQAQVPPQRDLAWKTFDTDLQGWPSGGGGWGVTHSIAWDGTLDVDFNPSSGAAKLTADFTSGTEAVFNPFDSGAGFDLTPFGGFKMWVYVDPATPVPSAGHYGTITARFRPPGYLWPGDVLNMGAISNTGWTELSAPFPAGNSNSMVQMNLHWVGSYAAEANLWVDNMTFINRDRLWHPFDLSAEGWGSGGWGENRTVAWDNTRDAQTNANSGSAMLTAEFTPGRGSTTFSIDQTVDLTNYQGFSLDLYVDPATPLGTNGHYGDLSVRLRPPGYLWPGDLMSFGTISNTGWTHIYRDFPLLVTSQFVQMNIHWDAAFEQATTIWMDNLTFWHRTATVTNPPPLMSLEKAGPGLEFVSCGTGDYTRRNIVTADGSMLGWVNYTAPVTYELTVLESPGPDAAGATPGTSFALNIWLLPTATVGINSADWNNNDGLFVEAKMAPDGAMYADVRFKTNAPGSHGIRNTPQGLVALATNTAARSFKGTWALTMSGNQVHLSGPAGLSADGTLPEDFPPLYAGGCSVAFGIQPYTKKDRIISMSRVRIYGGTDFTDPIDVDFTTTPVTFGDVGDLFTLRQEASDAGIHQRPTNTVWRLRWNLPDDGFGLFGSPSLSPANWGPITPDQAVQGIGRTSWLTPAEVSGSQYYFRLQK